MVTIHSADTARTRETVRGRTAPGEAAVTYYGLPAIKPSLYGWRVAAYMFIGGLAGGAQILATVADLLGIGGAGDTILAGRWIALIGAAIGAALLVIDLHTPRRFLNMLRIFRATSPMSIGTYVLGTFGFFSLLAVVGDLAAAPILATIAGIIAALAGLFMTTYTAALLAATATPLWAASPRTLAARFAAGAMATAAAALSLVAVASAPLDLERALNDVAIVAVAIELAFSIFGEWRYRKLGIDAPLRQAPWGPLHIVGVQVLGSALPIALYALDSWGSAGPGWLSIVASVLVLCGGLLMRGVILHAGNASAERPADYFRFTAVGRR
jgi:formate-dependent nitrite reductase membrane component NrfD